MRGVEFDADTAREASDFEEVIFNYSLTPEQAYDMFGEDQMSVGKRLYFAEKMPLDRATILLLLDPDDRIRQVVEARLKESREKENGGLVITA